MPILIDKTIKVNPQRQDEPGKWYLYSKSLGTVTEKEVARQLANRTALNRKEAEMALFLLREVVLENLKLGYTVRLSDWATFYTTVKSEGSATREEANNSKIKKVRPHLLYHPAFEQELQTATFMSVDSLHKKEIEE